MMMVLGSDDDVRLSSVTCDDVCGRECLAKGDLKSQMNSS